MITLYRKNALGIGVWSIWAEGDTLRIAHSSTIDGAMIQHSERVLQGRQGRSIEEQVQSRINSRVSKQRDKGYVESADEAAKGAFNQLGLTPPMLAQVYQGSTGGRKAWLQKKLNGLRCLITRQDGELIAYTRRGKRLLAIQEILEEADKFVQEGMTVDGELYVANTSLQTIQSWVKRRQPSTGKILYVMYDQMEGGRFSDRHDALLGAVGLVRDLKRCHVLPKIEYIDEETRAIEFAKAREKGFEGLMVRIDDYDYESNVRSASLLKDKAKFDTEVIVKDIVLSDKGNPVCIVDYKGLEFKLSPPGSHVDRRKSFEERSKYIGKLLTIEYREFTDDGIPFHAVATNWRVD